MTTMIENDRITLRPPEPADVDSLYLWENDRPEAESAPVSRLNLWEYVNNYDGDLYTARQTRFIIVDRSDGAAVGNIDIYDFDPANRRGAVAVYVIPGRRRRGTATAALTLLCDYAAANGLHQLWVHIAADNKPSLSLFTSAGFKPSGRLRSWLRQKNGFCDVIVMQKLFPRS